ncbi:hypothetical protein [Roseobacter sp. HKCCA0434]|uniref:hypothetical protein n=1 Tax=Roseobacter sp. HKCCA0434 TaxID=3079297 RepID=UPI002905F050|nr:hypothetical protein [Roseobacter sp. HKCCA0434]
MSGSSIWTPYRWVRDAGRSSDRMARIHGSRSMMRYGSATRRHGLTFLFRVSVLVVPFVAGGVIILAQYGEWLAQQDLFWVAVMLPFASTLYLLFGAALDVPEKAIDNLDDPVAPHNVRRRGRGQG